MVSGHSAVVEFIITDEEIVHTLISLTPAPPCTGFCPLRHTLIASTAPHEPPRDSISRSPRLQDGNATATQLCHRVFCGGDDDDDIKDGVCRFFGFHDCGRRRALGASRGRGARDGSGPRRGGRWLCYDQSPPWTSPNQRTPPFQQVCCWSM
jgi:hypothetical protein